MGDVKPEFLYVFLSWGLSSATASTSDYINVFREWAPSQMRIVRQISLGITIRPRSSIRRMIPVARCGNAVTPPVSATLVRDNLPEVWRCVMKKIYGKGINYRPDIDGKPNTLTAWTNMFTKSMV